MGLEDFGRGKKALVTVVVKEEQGAGLGFEGCYEFRERGPSQVERERGRGDVSKGPGAGVGRRLLPGAEEAGRRGWEACRPAPTMSQSSPRLVNQMSLRLRNRCQQREIGQWILCGPARLKPAKS